MTDRFQAKIYVLTGDEGGAGKPFLTNLLAQMYSNTFDIHARLDFVDKEMVLPGEDFAANVGVRI